MIKALIIFLLGAVFGMTVTALVFADREDDLEDEWLQELLDGLDDED